MTEEPKHLMNKCPKCGGNIIMFTADLDICQKCGYTMSGESHNPCKDLQAQLKELTEERDKLKENNDAFKNLSTELFQALEESFHDYKSINSSKYAPKSVKYKIQENEKYLEKFIAVLNALSEARKHIELTKTDS